MPNHFAARSSAVATHLIDVRILLDARRITHASDEDCPSTAK
jgi:hypothetical protein